MRTPPGRAAGRALARLADLVAAGALAAAALAAAAPSHALADHSDALLAALVLVTALGIAPGRLLALRSRAAALAALSIGPLIVLGTLGWAIGGAFDGPARDGVLALGLSSTEVASVGLVALAGGDAALVLGALAGSLVASALLGPPLAVTLGAAHGHLDGAALLGRFALVVIAPLAAGLALRARMPSLHRAEEALGGVAALLVCALVYAALSGVGGHGLLEALLGALAFLTASGGAAALIARGRPRETAIAITGAVGLRDFAVAAALAGQAFGAAAAAVSGVYGVLMLVSGAVAATALRTRSRRPAGYDPRP